MGRSFRPKVSTYTGTLPGEDFFFRGFDWTPVRIYNNGTAVSIQVSGPKCVNNIGNIDTLGDDYCGRILVPSDRYRTAICPNEDCGGSDGVLLEEEFDRFVQLARSEAIALDGRLKLKFPTLPE